MKEIIRLTKKESEKCKELFNKLCDSDTQLDQELTARFENADEIRQQIESGVDDFYQLYKEDVSKETIQKKIEENMSSMSNREKYSYLANLMVAITHICGNVFEGSKWNETLKDHEIVLSAVDLGFVDEESEKILNGIEEMKGMIAENIESFAVLFVDSPDFEELQDACMNESPEQVQAIAMNTREAAVNMAAAIYILQEDDELSSLKEVQYTPHDVGVMSASLLEIDAAQKSGSLEFAKKVFSKASRTAVTLLVASPAIIAGVSMFGIIALLTNFASIWLLVSGVILGINLHAHIKRLEEHMEPVFKVGAKILNTTLDKVKPIYHKISNWIQNTIVPAALPVWQRCRDFTVKRILVPSAAFLLNIKDKIVSVTGVLASKAKAIVRKLSVGVQDLFSAARNVMEQNDANEIDFDVESKPIQNVEFDEEVEDEAVSEDIEPFAQGGDVIGNSVREDSVTV